MTLFRGYDEIFANLLVNAINEVCDLGYLNRKLVPRTLDEPVGRTLYLLDPILS